MTDPLRFPIGPFHSPGSLNGAGRVAAIGRIAALPGALRDAVSDLSPEQLETPYRPAGWTVRQVVHHVADSHMNSLMRFKLGLTETNPTIQTYHEERWAELADCHESVEVSLTLLDALHRRWVSLLHSIDDAGWSRPIQHPEMGPMRLDELLAMYAWHSDHHVAHIRSLREREGW